MSEEKKFYKVEKGEFEICTPLLRFGSEENKKQYVVYTIESEERLGIKNIYATAYEGDLFDLPLFFALDQHEKEMVKDQYIRFKEKQSLKRQMDCQ